MPTKKDPLARALVDKIIVRNAKNFHDTRQLLLFVLARKDRESREQLG
jgi:hypothetical protein